MTDLSVSTIERRSGIEKQPNETLNEYLTRVGKRTDLPAEDITAIVNHANWQQFGSGADSSSTPEPPIEEFLAAVESIDETPTAETTTGTEADLQKQQQEETRSRSPLSSFTQDIGEIGNTDGFPVRIPIAIAAGLLLLAAVVSGAIVLNESTGLLASTDPAPDESPTPPAETNNTESEDTESEDDKASETTVVTSAAEAEGALDVTDMRVDGDDPEEEFIELTNVGEVTLDLSDWTVRDREHGGAVDAGGVDPATFPEGFTLEPGESVRLYTAPGENTEDTIHWGYYDRQNWHPDGDVIIVLDGDGDEVLRYEYGSPP